MANDLRSNIFLYLLKFNLQINSEYLNPIDLQNAFIIEINSLLLLDLFFFYHKIDNYKIF